MLLLRSTLLMLAVLTFTACNKPVEPLEHRRRGGGSQARGDEA